MNQYLPEYNLPELSGGPVNQLRQFDDILEKARDKGVVSDTPLNEEETYDLEKQRIRIQTIASRLWLLGYLPRKYKPDRIDNKLEKIKEAVGWFQREAGLKEDTWVGDITWYALDQLVSFESQIVENQWFSNGRIKASCERAVQRAVQLRLWSLGLYERKPNRNFNGLKDEALKRFGDILRIFIIKPSYFIAGLNLETIRLLFNQDILTDVIASRKSVNNSNAFDLNLPQHSTLKKALAQKFIVNCAKIELWLLGYDVAIDGRNDFLLSEGSDLQRAIIDFYIQFGSKTQKQARVMSKSITPELFTEIAASNKISDEYNEDDVSEEIAAEVKTEQDIDEAYGYVKKKGLRLWDGIKRLWRWIKRIGKKVISFIKQNIFKGFFRFVTKAFKIIKTGIVAVVKSVGVYIRGRLSSPGISFNFTKDMDTDVLISGNASDTEISKGIDKLNRQSRTFNISCRIIAWIFHVFKSMATGFLGWAKLLISLVKGFQELKKLYLDFKAIAQS